MGSFIGMKFIADFHIHSKYSRATSRDMDLENLDKWAKIKGIKVLGTGDFSHPEWFKSLKDKLEPAELGLFKMKKQDNGTRFILTNEISCIYSKTRAAAKGEKEDLSSLTNNRVRKIHILILAPSFEAVEKINVQLGWIGNLKSDGRPILGLDAKELAKIVLSASEDCLVIPAHCLPPDTFLHSNLGVKPIKDISVGDKVYTHQGRLKKVKQIYTRPYKGPVYNIRPYNFRIGLKTTKEHPFYIIKSYKDCKNCSHTICKPNCSYHKSRGCKHPYFKEYKPQWVQAKEVKKGDILIFPRFNNITKNIEEIKLNSYLSGKLFKVYQDKISCTKGRVDKKLNNVIKIDKEFCRLVGYYLSEGYADNRDSVSFCFHYNENKYIKDVKLLMKKVFGLSSPRLYRRKDVNAVEIIYFSKILAKVFSQIFYNSTEFRKAYTKCLPSWMLNLPLEKQVEVFRGWWRGDGGVTSSRELMNQMKIILLRLGIIPSIYEQTKEVFNKKYAHLYKKENRIIKAQHSSFIFRQLSFFEDLFGLLKTLEFKKFNYKLERRHCWIDKKNIYLPVLDIKVKKYKGKVYNLEVEGDNSYLSEFAAVHNCMTPWFAIFGSKSGFDSIEECFEDLSKYIYAMETGLSASPDMLWRMPDGRKTALISNSDAHSPRKIGREANVFDTELSYQSIVEAIKTKDPKKFLYTIEFFPEEGKYHFDGHRNCEVRLSPTETKKYNGICPVCGKPLTVGVLNRVDALSDKKEGFEPENAIPFKSLVPLVEIVADTLGMTVASKQVEKTYQSLIEEFGSEFEILLNTSPERLKSAALPEIAEGILRVREGRVNKEPGYDGVFGKIRIFDQGESKKLLKQKTLF